MFTMFDCNGAGKQCENGYLSDKIIRIMKPQECLHSQSRFSDIFMLEDHMKVHLKQRNSLG